MDSTVKTVNAIDMFSLIERIKQLFEEKKIESIFLLTSIVICFVSLVIFLATFNTRDDVNSLKSDNIQQHSKPSTPKTIVVDVSGAVVNPGIYNLNANKRIADVIELAGGLTPEADKVFIERNINRARLVQDQEKIYIPFTTLENQSLLGASTKNNLKVNINLASVKDLEDLPGIGPTTAEKIMSGRPYTSLNELLDKKILKKNIYEQVVDRITY